MKLRGQQSALAFDYSGRRGQLDDRFRATAEYIAKLVRQEDQPVATDQYIATFIEREFPGFGGK
jgi:hypothetical protein